MRIGRLWRIKNLFLRYNNNISERIVGILMSAQSKEQIADKLEEFIRDILFRKQQEVFNSVMMEADNALIADSVMELPVGTHISYDGSNIHDVYTNNSCNSIFSETVACLHDSEDIVFEPYRRGVGCTSYTRFLKFESAEGMLEVKPLAMILTDGLSNITTVSIFLHELAHILRYSDTIMWGWYKKVSSDTPLEELIADTFSYLAMRLLGFDCAERLLSVLSRKDRIGISQDMFKGIIDIACGLIKKHADGLFSPSEIKCIKKGRSCLFRFRLKIIKAVAI